MVTDFRDRDSQRVDRTCHRHSDASCWWYWFVGQFPCIYHRYCPIGLESNARCGTGVSGSRRSATCRHRPEEAKATKPDRRL